MRDHVNPPQQWFRVTTTSGLISILSVFAVGISLGYWAGQRPLPISPFALTSSTAKSGWHGPELSTHRRKFEYIQAYGRPPSAQTDSLWNALFPQQGGFFKHPSLAPSRSAFSVFHQLHCLNGIRQGYWALYDAAAAAAMPEIPFDEAKLPPMSRPPHFRHCIDLLRQSLMCSPDLTVELKNVTMGGVTGFGTEHVCKDWNQLLQWTAKWETFQQDTNPKPANMMATAEAHVHHD